MKAQTLEEHLHEFSGVKGDINKLEQVMASVASHFLYGGYFIVGNSKVELTDIEFYYHEEGDEGKIHDWIMYHIDHKSKVGHLPPFEFGSLNAHVSGVDFTFEDPKGKYRASILIRGASKDGGKPETRPTYIYEYFMMHNPVFGDGFRIKWYDLKYDPDCCTRKIVPVVRWNVPQYYDKDFGKYKKGDRILAKDRTTEIGAELKLGKETFIQCQRKWRFKKQEAEA